MPYEVVFEDFWQLDEDAKDDCFDDFEKRHRNRVRSIGPEAMYEAWMKGGGVAHLLGLFPAEWNDTQKAALLGVDTAQIGRWRRSETVPHHTTYLYGLRCLKAKFPDRDIEYPLIPLARIYDAIGVAATSVRIQHDLNPRQIPAIRERRRVLDGVSAVDAAIVYCLTHPDSLLEEWLYCGERFGHDLRVGLGSAELDSFLTELVDRCSALFDNQNADPFFKQQSNEIANIDLGDEYQARQLLERIAALWNSSQVISHCVIHATESDLVA